MRTRFRPSPPGATSASASPSRGWPRPRGRAPLVIVNHFPLRQDLAVLPRIPRFSIWCGTRLTEDWHVRYRAQAVVYGHLHIRATHHRDGVRFEEASLGYPQNWDAARGVEPYLRQILPDPHAAPVAANPLEGSIYRPQG